MSKSRAVPRLPPLSMTTLEIVLEFERRARVRVADCHYDGSFNVEAAVSILRTSILITLDLRIKDYASRPDYDPEWMDQIKVVTFDSMIANLTSFASEQDKQRIRRELVFTMDDHLAALKAEAAQRETEAAEMPAVNRRQLYDTYLANFPDEKIVVLDICWAAQQHYRELRRWLKGELKDSSTPDLAFRRILTSGKRPLEFNKKPRPSGWQ